MSALTAEVKNTIINNAKTIRQNALKAIVSANSGHPGGSLSATDILSVLYFGVMNYSQTDPKDPNRDYLIVSKGHISPAIYSALGIIGYINTDEFVQNFRQVNQQFQGHIDRLKVPGVEVSTGSLGQGLSVAGGVAMGLKAQNKNNHVFAILSDGELQEGQTWEALMSSAHYKLNNLTVIVDRNRLQLDGRTEETMQLESLKDKFQAFNWEVQEIDGHNIDELYNTLSNAKNNSRKKPLIILANTIKGKGVSYMEDQVGWHGKAPNAEQLEQALQELE